MLSSIVADALTHTVDCVLIAGDLFHTGQILPKTFAKTIEALQPLKDAGIPCIAVEGNHDWIHRRDSISWMEALSRMGYLRLLRPAREPDGSYRFDPFDEQEGTGGCICVNGYTVYGLGYIGTLAGSHVERICSAVSTQHNLLLFHVGIWSYSPVEIGCMHPDEAAPLQDRFQYVALGHGHKPYTLSGAHEITYAFNPGAPECVNFGEERYDKGYYLVEMSDHQVDYQVMPTTPRPMLVVAIDLTGCRTAEQAATQLRTLLEQKRGNDAYAVSPLIELKLVGTVEFHPFELGKEQVRSILDQVYAPLHSEIKNQLNLSVTAGDHDTSQQSLSEIEQDVLRGLISSNGGYEQYADSLVDLAISIRDQVIHHDGDAEEIIALLKDY